MSTPEGAFSVFPLAAAVTAPAGALSVFHHYRSSDRSPQEHYLYFPTATAVSAPAGALSIYFLTAAAVLAPAGAFPSPGPSPAPPPPLPTSLLLHYRSSACSCRNLLYIPHYRSSACPSKILLYISPLPQQWPLPQEHLLFCPHYRSSVRSRRSSLSISNAAAVTAPAGALPVFPHCPSSVCSRRSSINISPLPQQCPLPQERYLYFPTAAAVSAPAGAQSIFPHCRSSVCSRRSFLCRSSARSRRSSINTSPLPQQCLLPQEHHIYFPTAAAVSTLTSSLLSPHRHASTLQQKPLLPPRCRSIITNGVQHPISPKAMQFLGGSLSHHLAAVPR